MKKIQSPYISGLNAVAQALLNSSRIRKIFVARDRRSLQRVREVEKLARENGVELQYVPLEKVQYLSGDERAVIAAEVSEVELLPLSSLSGICKEDVFLLLESIEDAGNMGAILRSAAAFGVSGVILTRGCAPLRSEAWKSSSGGLAALRFYRLSNLYRDLEFLKNQGLLIVALAPAGKQTIWEWRFDRPIVFCLGNEHRGLAGTVLKNADLLLRIPQKDTVESLNVAQTAAIVLAYAYSQNITAE